MKTSELHASKVQIPFPVVDLLEPDILAAEDMADVDPTCLPTDPAIGAYEADLEVVEVLERWEALGKPPRRESIVRGGRSRSSTGDVSSQGMANLLKVSHVSTVTHVAGLECYLSTRSVPGHRLTKRCSRPGPPFSFRAALSHCRRPRLLSCVVRRLD